MKESDICFMCSVVFISHVLDKWFLIAAWIFSVIAWAILSAKGK